MAQSALRDRKNTNDLDGKKRKLMQEIKDDYENYGQNRTTVTKQRYIMLVGRTRTGKSTIKTLLQDPTTEPRDLTLKSQTRNAELEAVFINTQNVVLNILDTPGLFERSSEEIDPRDNEVILETIRVCAERELTQFHVICFCASITDGINKEDIEALKILRNFLGEGISKNACMIITRCESKDSAQRTKIEDELKKDKHFSELKNFFQLGVFFSGALNYDDYNKGRDSILEQFITICEYRNILLELFLREIKPMEIKNTLMSNYLCQRDEQKKRLHEALKHKVAQDLKQTKQEESNGRKGICLQQ